MISFWASALAVSLLLYVMLDGFDLGVGMLFPFARSEAEQRRMMSAISPVWDGNETWLVITAAVTWMNSTRHTACERAYTLRNRHYGACRDYLQMLELQRCPVN